MNLPNDSKSGGIGPITTLIGPPIPGVKSVDTVRVTAASVEKNTDHHQGTNVVFVVIGINE